jgi:hypothetical protein
VDDVQLPGWAAGRDATLSLSSRMVLVEGIFDTRPLRYGDEIVLSELTSLALLRSSAGLGLIRVRR